MERSTFQILTLMNFHEPLEIKSDFQQPSSSESPLLHQGVGEGIHPEVSLGLRRLHYNSFSTKRFFI